MYDLLALTSNEVAISVCRCVGVCECIYVCVFVYVYLYMCTYTSAYVRLFVSLMCKHESMYVLMYIYMCECIYVSAYLFFLYISVYVCLHI
jgi:hypothetical protein